jgi:hypothetical protein
MKTSKFNVKDVLGKLGFLKNNLGLLVPILIAVVAVLLFIPTRILRGKLQTQVEQQSVQPGQRITRLIKDAGKAGEVAALERYVNAFAKDANTVELLATQTTLRELLTYKLFPDTNERSTLLFEEVRQKYISGIEAMLQSMAAGTPPTDTEIDAALKNAPRPMGYGAGYGGAYSRGGPMMSGTPGTPGYGQQRSWTIATETDRKIFDKVCEDKARAAKVYVDPMSLDGYQYWNEWKFEDRDKAYRACWYWQLGYWIIEDVAATVRTMNKDAQCIPDAPVKRIMNISFNQKRIRGYPGMMGMGMRRGMRRTDKDKQGPVYVTSARDAMASPPCTGRYTNEENDIVHFDVRVILQESQVIPFIQQLCSAKEHKFRGFYGDLPEQKYKHNQITVLESTLTPINPEDREHYLCRYGTESPYELELICEYLFNSKAYDQIKPALIKEDIANAGKKTQAGQRR